MGLWVARRLVDPDFERTKLCQGIQLNWLF
jgi:hypothetical protein